MWTCLCARSIPITHGLSSLGTARPQSTPKTCVARPPVTTIYWTCPFAACLAHSPRLGLVSLPAQVVCSTRTSCSGSTAQTATLTHVVFFFCPMKVTFSSSASLCLFLLNNSLFFFHLEPEDFSLESTNLTPSMPICNIGIFYLLKHKLPLWSFSK